MGEQAIENPTGMTRGALAGRRIIGASPEVGSAAGAPCDENPCGIFIATGDSTPHGAAATLLRNASEPARVGPPEGLHPTRFPSVRDMPLGEFS